jgi:hypothetical protein
MIHLATICVPYHIGTGGEKSVYRIATGEGQLVNVLTR